MRWDALLGFAPRAGEGSARRPAAGDQSHYQLLGVDPTAELFVIEAAYRAQMRRCHPDRGGDTARAQLINGAYRVLCDAEARGRYDEELRAAWAERRDLAAARPLRRERTGAALAALTYAALGLVLAGWGMLAGYGLLHHQERSLAARAAGAEWRATLARRSGGPGENLAPQNFAPPGRNPLQGL